MQGGYAGDRASRLRCAVGQTTAGRYQDQDPRIYRGLGRHHPPALLGQALMWPRAGYSDRHLGRAVAPAGQRVSECLPMLLKSFAMVGPNSFVIPCLTR